MKFLCVVALFGCLYYSVEGRTKCYECTYVRATASGGFSSEAGEECKDGEDVVDDADKTNCNSMGCATYELNFESGSVEYEIIVRGCVDTLDSGNLDDTCMDAEDYFSESEQDLLTTIFLGGPGSSSGGSSSSATMATFEGGTVCGCQSDLCNAAMHPTMSTVVSLLSAIAVVLIYF